LLVEGIDVGDSLGLVDGTDVGGIEGVELGDELVGVEVGLDDGAAVGVIVADGLEEGCTLGAILGPDNPVGVGP
jgi:hypothetical protein